MQCATQLFVLSHFYNKRRTHRQSNPTDAWGEPLETQFPTQSGSTSTNQEKRLEIKDESHDS